MKLTLADIKTNIARIISMSGTDSRVIDYINEVCCFVIERNNHMA